MDGDSPNGDGDSQTTAYGDGDTATTPYDNGDAGVQDGGGDSTDASGSGSDTSGSGSDTSGDGSDTSGGGDAGSGYPLTCTCADQYTVTVYCPTRESAASGLCDCSDPRHPKAVCGPIY